MFWRISTFLLSQLAGALVGWYLAADKGAEAGIIVGGTAWFAVDLLRGARMVRWLRRGANGAPTATAGIWGEAGDRVRRLLRSREMEVRDAQQRLQEFLAAIQASPNGVVLLDAAGRIEWCNQTAAEHFGIDGQRDVLQLIGNLLRDPLFSAYYAGGDYLREVVLQGPQSSPSRPQRLAVHLHPYGQGRKLLLSRDVTLVEQAEAMRRDFVANVSHEIRTPLTVLTGFVETLQSIELPPEERQRYLHLMAQQAQRMQTLVNDLLTLSRLEGSPLPGAGEWTPAAAMASQCEHEAHGLARLLARKLDLQFGAAPEVELAGSANELQSALSNLVSNAIRYTPAEGRIEVQWRLLDDGRLEFAVRDTGPGIAQEHIPRLTERFYRVDRSRSRETGGTGLGLAIVKHVLQRHGAELKIDSELGRGSTFAIQFPASRVRPRSQPVDDAQPSTESQAG